MRPLSYKFRRSLFWALLVIFVVGTPILIGYSKGYRLDDALLLVETGGIYIHSEMSNTMVYINGEFFENNGGLFKNTLMQDLKPNREYEVWVEKEGYQSWTKILTVRPNLVTEARVLMLPDLFIWHTITATSAIEVDPRLLEQAATTGGTSTATTTALVENPAFIELEEFFESYKEQFAVEIATSTYTYVRDKRVATTTTTIKMQFPKWLSKVASTSVLSEKEMVRERDGTVTWLDYGDVYAMWAREDDTQPPYYFCTRTCTRYLIIDWDEPITRYEFYPNRNDVVILGTEQGIYAVELDDRSQRNIQPILEEPTLDFRLEGDGTLIVYDGKVYRETSW